MKKNNSLEKEKRSAKINIIIGYIVALILAVIILYFVFYAYLFFAYGPS